MSSPTSPSPPALLTPSEESKRPALLLPLLVCSLLSCTSLWFAGNAVLGDLTEAWSLGPQAMGWTISSVQLGFLLGTLGSAWFGLADRFAPRRIFFVCALCGAALTALPVLIQGLVPLLLMRFLTGVFLAGIYPIAMKLAASWYRKDVLGLAMGYLVSALAIGTSVPHFIKGVGKGLPWQGVLITVACIAVIGGFVVLTRVPEGPYGGRTKKIASAPVKHEEHVAKEELGVMRTVFSIKDFRAAAIGYIGHMWELYAFWAFVPGMLAWHATRHGYTMDGSMWSFAVIASGGLGCVMGGYLSRLIGSARTASVMLFVSGVCSITAPLFFLLDRWLFLPIMFVWGISVIGDSAQFSTLYSKAAPPRLLGSAITIVTALGFGITIVSIELVSMLDAHFELPHIFPLIALGPLLSFVVMGHLRRLEA